MTFIIYYQHNYNYYQYKQTEIKLEFYLFREYLPETILNHHLDRFCIFRRLCTEKMTCAITRFLSLYHIDIILILIVKSLHSTFQHSILVPVYRIRPVPIPDIGYHIVFLAFKLSRLVTLLPCNAISHHHLSLVPPDNRLVLRNDSRVLPTMRRSPLRYYVRKW